MTRFLTLLTVLLLLSFSAFAELNLDGVRAVPNQKLAFRTGPNTAFGELYTLPESTDIVALEIEYGNDVPWVLVEYQYNGKRVRAYTGLKRMDLTGYVPNANHERLARRLVNQGTVYAAPDLHAEIRATLSAGTTVTFLGYEGAFCFIEYTAYGEQNRGYVREEDFMVDLGETVEDFPKNDQDTFYVIEEYAYLYESPSQTSAILRTMRFDESVTVLDSCFDAAPDDWIEIYYGGLKGYTLLRDVCDLRFASPEQARQTLG